MKLVILGANGRTGAHVLRGALGRGDDVTAIVRSEDKRPPLRADRLTVVVGDPCDPKLLARVLDGQDTVISTLGGRFPTKRAMSVYSLSANAIASAAGETGLRNVVVTSSALLFPPRRPVDRLLARVVPSVVRSATMMEQILRTADLDVTAARCGFLTDAEETAYRATRDALPENGHSVSRRGLARFLLEAAQSAASGYRVYGVAGPDRGPA